jgi:hypothetical protein
MSHASLLVVTDAKPTQNELQEILLPWHEYECTGIERYLVDVDETEEITKQFNEPQKVVVFADGRVLSRWSEELYVKKDGGRIDGKEFELPPGARETEMTAEEARAHGVGYKSMADAAEQWCGAVERDGRYYKRTNPNRRWDWWQVGGRWTGLLSPGYDPEKDPANIETCRLCDGTGRRADMVVENGCNGCQGTGRCVKWPTAWVKFSGDQARWGSLDLEKMLAEACKRKSDEWNKAEAEFEKKVPDKVGFFGTMIQQYEGVLADLRADMDAGRGTGALYQRIEANPRATRLRELVGHANGWDYSIEGAYTRVAHVATAQPLTCWAIVKDGRWYERGKMGWWGMSSGDAVDWPETMGAVLSSIRPDQWVTVVDYHI